MSACLAQEGLEAAFLARSVCSAEEPGLHARPDDAAFDSIPRRRPERNAPLIRAATAVGTGDTMQPSASKRPSYSTGLNRPGNAQVARMATSSGPRVKT